MYQQAALLLWYPTSLQPCHSRSLTSSPGHIFLEGRRDREHQGAFWGLVSAPGGMVAHLLFRYNSLLRFLPLIRSEPLVNVDTGSKLPSPTT